MYENRKLEGVEWGFMWSCGHRHVSVLLRAMAYMLHHMIASSQGSWEQWLWMYCTWCTRIIYIFLKPSKFVYLLPYIIITSLDTYLREAKETIKRTFACYVFTQVRNAFFQVCVLREVLINTVSTCYGSNIIYILQIYHSYFLRLEEVERYYLVKLEPLKIRWWEDALNVRFSSCRKNTIWEHLYCGKQNSLMLVSSIY